MTPTNDIFIYIYIYIQKQMLGLSIWYMSLFQDFLRKMGSYSPEISVSKRLVKSILSTQRAYLHEEQFLAHSRIETRFFTSFPIQSFL